MFTFILFNYNFTDKILDFSGIQTWVFGVEGEHINHPPQGQSFGKHFTQDLRYLKIQLSTIVTLMAFGTFSFNLGNYPYLCWPKFSYMCNIIGKYYIEKATGTGHVVPKLYIKIFSKQREPP